MLHLKCKGQEMKVDVDERIADKYINANKVHFEFCERWAGMIITAQFTQKQDGVDKTYDVVIDELTNMVTMPNEIVAGEVHISAFGVDPVTGVRITSIPVKKTIDKSGFVGDGETPVPPTPDLYAQLLEQFGNGVPPSTGANKQLVTDKSGAIAWDNLRVMAGTKNGAVRTSAAAAEQVLGYKLGEFAFAANLETEASGYAAFAAGNGTEAIGKNSFAEGNGTIANGENQHVQGKFNVKDTANKYAHIVGNGMTNAKRANAHTLDWDGNAWFKGDVYVGGDDQSKGEKLVTQSELNAAVAAGGGGSGEGGGGGLPTGGEPNTMLVTDGDGNAKWEARTHWKEEGLIDVLPECNFEVDPDTGEGIIMTPFVPIPDPGKTYTVSWNGTAYECIAEVGNMNGVPLVMLGNTSAFGGTQATEDPFLIVAFPAEIVESMGGMTANVLAFDGSTEITLRIQQAGTTYHKLDAGYLPIPMKTGTIEHLKETTLSIEPEAGMGAILEPFAKPLAIGDTYTIVWNGVVHTCTAWAYSEGGELQMPALGNGSALDESFPSSNDPFLVIFVPDVAVEEIGGFHGMVIPLDGSETATLRIYGDGGVKIDNSALDMDWVAKLDNVGETIAPETVYKGRVGNVAVTDGSFFEVGNTFIAYVDNKRYDLEVREYEGMVYAGDIGAMAGQVITGEPFIIGKVGDKTLNVQHVDTSDINAIHTVSLYLPGSSQRVPHEKLPETFIPYVRPFYVTLTTNDYDTYIADKEYSEIMSAYNSNCVVCCVIEKTDIIFYLSGFASGKAHFFTFFEGRMQSVVIDSGKNATLQMYQLQTPG